MSQTMVSVEIEYANGTRHKFTYYCRARTTKGANNSALHAAETYCRVKGIEWQSIEAQAIGWNISGTPRMALNCISA